jgi:hypothetical protein
MRSFKELGIDNFYITLEEEVQASNKDVVNQRVNHYICEYDSINNGFNCVRTHNKRNEPINEEPINEEPIDEEPVNEEPVNEEPVNEDHLKQLRIPNGIRLTTLDFLNDENPYKRGLIMREIAKQIIQRDITATREVIECLKQNITDLFF